MSHAEVMALPLKTFWLMNKNADRIMALSDLRGQMVAMSSQFDSEQITSFRQQLSLEAGDLVKTEKGEETDSRLEAKRDDAGFASLQMMSGQMIGGL